MQKTNEDRQIALATWLGHQSWRAVISCAAAILIAWPAAAAIPPAEKLLPDDTLVMVTATDVSKLRESGKTMPLVACWNDPAMKPFREKFVAKWEAEVIKPLERELDIKLSDYTGLLQGQFTIALTQNGWQGQEGQVPGLVFLLDTRDKSNVLKKDLAELRKKWVASGKSLRTEKVRDIEFMVLPISTNDLPATVRKLLPNSTPVQELGDDKAAAKTPKANELVVGQFESLLLAGNSAKALEKVVIRLKGGSLPSLGESAAYQPNHLALFREAPVYGWLNAKPLYDLLVHKLGEKQENPDAPNPFDFKPEKILSAMGLAGLKTLAFTFQQSREGGLLQFFAGVPETTREGLFKILAGEPKDCTPPAFIPADAMKFTRWRIDGQKAWATLEKTISNISPQWLSGINFLLDTANTAAREKDPSFDVRKNLIGNLGDDLLSYQKAPKDATLAALSSPPSIFLVGSPHPDELAAALKSVLVYMTQQAGAAPQEREFLGRKIYTVPLRAMGSGGSGNSGSAGTSLHYAAAKGYVALSTDSAMLEEFLRRSDSEGKSLRDTPGLSAAIQQVGGPGTCFFGYENNVESLRGVFESLRKAAGADGGSSNASLLQSTLGLPVMDESFKDWADFSLLPPFESISKYFYINVYGGSATTEGLMLKAFDPAPPGLKQTAAK